MKSQNKNFPSIVLRFFLVYGPHQNKNKIVSHAIINCLMNKKFYLSKGVQKRDYCYIDDITRAIFLALKSKHNGEIINIGSGKPLTVRFLVNYIRKLIGRGKPVFGGIKYRNKDSNKLEYVHTLNGSGLATPRLMVSLLETYQNKDGTFSLPEVLNKYIKNL